MSKVLVAMSGGVDSSVAAALLKRQGHELCGVTLKLFENEDIGIRSARACCSLADVEDARRVAAKLGFRHVVFSYAEEFKNDVISRFASEYAAGRTPNPCIDCNRFIKFPRLLSRARLLGFEYVATGHYARIECDNSTGRWLLKKARDISKDQTYVLYAMTQDELAHTLLPLGGLLKSEVRRLAEELKLVNAAKPDSQDICFVPDGDYAAFLEQVIGVNIPKGDFVDSKGNVLGRHKGHHRYTIGQRKGLGIGLGEPRYVIGKDPTKNTVVLGAKDELMSSGFTAKDVNWIMFDRLREPMQATVKTRYRQPEVPAVLYPQKDGVLVKFNQSEPSAAPGQSAVFYHGDTVVGGGIISEIIK
ncbi:MAG TPA: tRNA 2-thiouridine(34) synthase MnmA [Candidatus Avimonas sp.]|jgi:tRNA-specific 2-thiouridylase|nr:tRNA 2-thiouridine(34) synthase MnmA [Clostridiales bacterium]HOB36521.1 tRNA 2-thiouridine(34) synthase MnmA [Candidatus Avimonas sp.]HQA16406.1 tRNA 2-thiouridine(34) synthase MnmA [Candidatus Avimonas sp.]HQD37954.1 tRNA 2-thiouridine(34) synthase MnmA [Candidatus Avimonas sp.]